WRSGSASCSGFLSRRSSRASRSGRRAKRSTAPGLWARMLWGRGVKIGH
ncbi:MAG: hypothetical protein AVDCRST_MAG55-683, partial [uncultured Rubrobacteraceae bacterium]